jgi:hypothetical protein
MGEPGPIEKGVEAEKRKQREFFELAERFRAASDPEEVRRLGDQIGRMVLGDSPPLAQSPKAGRR